MKHVAILALGGLLASTAPLLAADIDVEAPIRSVVVYPQGASITRESPFTVPRGTNVLVIGGIPTGIDPSTIRIEGLADAGVEIRSVETVQEKHDDADDPERERIQDEIDALRARQAVLNDQLTALQGQRAFIQNLIEAGPAGFADFLGTAGGGIDQWATAWQMIGQGLDQVLANTRQIQNEIADIDRQINELNRELASLPSPRVGLEIRVELAAEVQANGTLTATYQVSNARWTPAYDAMLVTGDDMTDPSIELIRRADIVQQTGEDWVDVTVTLSTTRPAAGTAAPTLNGTIARVYEQNGRLAMMPAPAPAAEAAGFARQDAEMPNDVIGQQQAIADFGDFRADFIIQGPVSVMSGAGTRSVRIATDAAPARLFVEASPRLGEQAFLTAAFTLDSQAPILAGRANLFRDGSYVGSGSLAFSGPGEEVRLGFGQDDQVRVTFSLVSRESGQRGLLTRMETDERLYRITVANNHSRSIEITVLDRVPVSEDERITVEQLDATTEPTETDVNGRRGVLAWTYDYEPGETREITNAYRLTWPADLYITGIE